MLACIGSAAVNGIEAYGVTVEVHCAAGLPQITVVGLAAGAVKESRDRVSAALVNSGYVLPPRRIVVNLAPADIRKEGTAFDLPIAAGLLVASGQLRADAVTGLCAIGELGLDGTIRPVRGVLPVARWAAGLAGPMLVIPPGNVGEAQLVAGARVAAPATLRELVEALAQGALRPIPPAAMPSAPAMATDCDLSDIVGQSLAKRGLEIAAAGNHGLLLAGPPGAGKTMLARCLPGILPPLTEAEALEVIAVHSVAGLLATDRSLTPARPFRAPHHTISAAGLIGGGSVPRPGEISLAHLGVLFLDEMLEFPRRTLDALRQPMEDGSVTLSRAAGSIRYPTRFSLVGATNPCPCGRAGDGTGRCTCGAAEITRYRGRLSGPLADRIDLHLVVSAVPIRELAACAHGVSSASARARVADARRRQWERYASLGPCVDNSRVPGRWLARQTPVEAAAAALLASAAERLGLSARAYHRVLRVARTIADLDGDGSIREASVAEALQFRQTGYASERDGGATRVE